MDITVNGEKRAMADGATLLALLEALGLDARVVAAQVNDRIIARGAHGDTVLHDGDMVELVRFVGGG